MLVALIVSVISALVGWLLFFRLNHYTNKADSLVIELRGEGARNEFQKIQLKEDLHRAVDVIEKLKNNGELWRQIYQLLDQSQ